MMFITHDIAVVNHVSDNLIVMKDGAIIEKGTPFDIINNPKEKYTQNLISSTL